VQIDRKGIENMFMNMVLEKEKTFKNTHMQSDTFPSFFRWEWDKHILIWNE
jgi:hypothetical protein